MLKVKKRRLGYAVKQIRRVRNLSKNDLAQSLAISKKEVCQIEDGKRPLTEQELKKIAAVLDVPDGCLKVLGASPNKASNKELKSFHQGLQKLVGIVIEAQEELKKNGNGKAKEKKKESVT